MSSKIPSRSKIAILGIGLILAVIVPVTAGSIPLAHAQTTPTPPLMPSLLDLISTLLTAIVGGSGGGGGGGGGGGT